MTAQFPLVPHDSSAAPVSGGRHCGDWGGKKRQTREPCERPAGWGTPHPGTGKCKLHGGSAPIKHGRYSVIKREELRELIEEFEADPDPLNIFPELATLRALVADYINRYEAYTEALIAWHISWRPTQRPLPAAAIGSLKELLDEYESWLDPRSEEEEAEDGPNRQHDTLDVCRGILESLETPDHGKPPQVLDIADAYRILDAIGKMVEREHKRRSANYISRPEFYRIMAAMGHVVEQANTIPDPDTRLKVINDGWLSVRLG